MNVSGYIRRTRDYTDYYVCHTGFIRKTSLGNFYRIVAVSLQTNRGKVTEDCVVRLLFDISIGSSLP